jgi:tetratricopeptide (TPR) repeat protein
MDVKLRELSEQLREGQRRSRQGSYRRRSPANAAVPYLQQAREGLRQLVEEQPGNAQAWRLLAQAEEVLLDYRNARLALEKVLALESDADSRDRKKLALLREHEAWWEGLGLTPAQLAELGCYLEMKLSNLRCDRTLRHTRAWLERSGPPNPDQIIQALEDRSGYSDWQVLHNVVR